MSDLELPPPEDQVAIELARASSDILGTTAGALIGLAVGGPPGTIVGAATGPVMSQILRKVAVDIKHRLLSRREESRIGTVFLLTANEIRLRLDSGEKRRQDGFFYENEGGRSTAEEITEGVFLAAQREYEERKLPYLASLLSGFVFDPQIGRQQAVALLRLAQSLSYRQLCLMVIFRRLHESKLSSDQERDPPRVPSPLNTSTAGGGEATATIAAELEDIVNKGIVLAHATVGGGALYFGEPPGDRLTRLGNHLYLLMKLERVPVDDVEEVLAELRRGESEPPLVEDV